MLCVGAIARLGVTGCHFHSGLMGHLLKSRARVNQVLYSRLIDGIGGPRQLRAGVPGTAARTR